MNKTLNKNSVVAKVDLKNIIDKAWTEISSPKYKSARKKAALSVLIICAAVAGIWFSFAMMAAGIQILVENGVSETLIKIIIGVLLCFVGFAALGSVINNTIDALRDIVYGKGKEATNNEEAQ